MPCKLSPRGYYFSCTRKLLSLPLIVFSQEINVLEKIQLEAVRIVTGAT